MPNGVYTAIKKNGTTYYRSSITYRNKHISLGSFDSFEKANTAYISADTILHTSTTDSDPITELTTNLKKYEQHLSYDKIISLINFRDNGVYFSNPIYLRKKFFYYFISVDYVLQFDVEDLFYYASHRIQKRGNRLFVADYGMQITLKSRYGIKSYGVEGRDYIFINGDNCDYRYENIRILSRYTGVFPINTKPGSQCNSYCVKIHLNGNITVGRYEDETTAAISYNKAVDILKKYGIKKKYGQNYIEDLSAEKYADIYTKLNLKSFENKIKKLL